VRFATALFIVGFTWISASTVAALITPLPEQSKDSQTQRGPSKQQPSNQQNGATKNAPNASAGQTQNPERRTSYKEKIIRYWDGFVGFLINNDRFVTAVSSIILAAVTSLLAVSTALLWFVTKKVANAAKKSAEALPAIERAYVFVDISLYQTIVATQDGTAASPVTVAFRNHGKTPAILEKLRAYCIISQETPQELIAFPGSEHELPQGLVIAASDRLVHQVDARVKTSELGEIERGDRRLFCAGRIEYRDVLGDRRETGFCWQYRHHMVRGSFIITPNTKLNYYT
jgi:hypothetical protein